jgi:zinc transport system ATP-binding protein
MTSPTQISVKQLSFSYGNAVTLDDLNFQVNQGDYIGLIGPNGGGKTTLVKILLGLQTPSKGEISLFNSPTRNLALNQKIGYVPQRASQNLANFPATVFEIVASGLVKSSLESSQKTVERALEITEIKKLANKLISDLSGGELQKVLIARALVSEPEILILDEPIVGVDAPSQESFYKFLKKLNQDFKITIIFVSHDLEVITKQANKVFCLNKKLSCHHDPKSMLTDHTVQEIFGKDMHLIHHHH